MRFADSSEAAPIPDHNVYGYRSAKPQFDGDNLS